MTIFITLIIIYMLVSYFGVRIYFCFQNGLKDKKNSLSKLVFTYLIFFLFILVEIPFVIFFPAWISEKLDVFERTSETTMFLILFGVVVLIGAIWKGRASRANNF